MSVRAYEREVTGGDLTRAKKFSFSASLDLGQYNCHWLSVVPQGKIRVNGTLSYIIWRPGEGYVDNISLRQVFSWRINSPLCLFCIIKRSFYATQMVGV